jgi:hypothetical protein
MSSILGPAHPDRPDEAIRDLPTEIPDEDLDRPIIQIKSEVSIGPTTKKIHPLNPVVSARVGQ